MTLSGTVKIIENHLGKGMFRAFKLLAVGGPLLPGQLGVPATPVAPGASASGPPMNRQQRRARHEKANATNLLCPVLASVLRECYLPVMLSYLHPELRHMIRTRPLVSVAVDRDRYSVGYSPPGTAGHVLLVPNCRVIMLLLKRMWHCCYARDRCQFIRSRLWR